MFCNRVIYLFNEQPDQIKNGNSVENVKIQSDVLRKKIKRAFSEPIGSTEFFLGTYTLLGLVFFFLFNGISTFVGYLMPELFFLKNSSGTI